MKVRIICDQLTAVSYGRISNERIHAPQFVTRAKFRCHLAVFLIYLQP